MTTDAGNGIVYAGRRPWCDCCQTKRSSLRLRAQPAARLFLPNVYQIDLCESCAKERHDLGRCFICGAWIWSCAQRNHLATVHQRIIERRLREPEDPPIVINENLKLIGRIDVDAVKED